MAVDVGHVDDPSLANIRFGRNRALVVLAGLAFQIALQVAGPPKAAGHNPPQLPPCRLEVQQCHCCPSCSQPSASCWNQSTCWFACTDCNTMYRCCDYLETDPHSNPPQVIGCTCRTFWGVCSGQPC